MARESVHGAAWELVWTQHGVIARRQLRQLGFSDEAIDHRIERGRLHPIFRGVYAVGRPEVSRLGRWRAATLAAGDGAVLSHDSAGALMRIRPYQPQSAIEVSVPAERNPRPQGFRVHRRQAAIETGWYERIPVTSPICTLVDLAARLHRDELEAAVNEADKRDLVDVETLRAALDVMEPRAGIAPLKRVIDIRTFVYTDSKLERDFLPIALRAGLPLPETQRYVGSYRVDFLWRLLGLLVETDGLRYHRTPAQQAADRVRDQEHTAAGLTTLRFTHGQIRYEPEHVERILAAVARRRMAEQAA
jgi:very-short-patch-repair endonuclease/predicted transcriptional regulator of viral defense system